MVLPAMVCFVLSSFLTCSVDLTGQFIFLFDIFSSYTIQYVWCSVWLPHLSILFFNMILNCILRILVAQNNRYILPLGVIISVTPLSSVSACWLITFAVRSYQSDSATSFCQKSRRYSYLHFPHDPQVHLFCLNITKLPFWYPSF